MSPAFGSTAQGFSGNFSDAGVLQPGLKVGLKRERGRTGTHQVHGSIPGTWREIFVTNFRETLPLRSGQYPTGV